VIEEKADDGTNMDNVKALLKDRKQAQVQDLLEMERPKLPPMSEDIEKRKKNILMREEKIIKQVERLASLQQRYSDQHEKQRSEKQIVSLPMIKPRHAVHQSVDNIKVSQPLLGRLQNQIVHLSNDKANDKVQINNLVNLRYKNRATDDDSQSNCSNPLPTPKPVSLQRRLLANYNGDDEESDALS